MNSAQILYDRFGIVSELDSCGRVIFSNVGRCLAAVSGDDAAWQEIRQLMIDTEQHGREYLRQDDRVIVSGQRQVIVLYPAEIRRLLAHDTDLYVKALKRGKGVKRLQGSERQR